MNIDDRRALRRSAPRFPLLALAAAAAACLPAASVSAADPGQLGCIAATLGSERGPAARRAADAFMAGGADTPELRQAVSTCAARFGWPEEAATDALYNAMASLTEPLFAAELDQAGGLDVEWLRREILADAALIRAASERRPRPPELVAFLERIAPALQHWVGSIPADQQERRFLQLAQFITSTAVAEGSRLAFAAR